MTTYEKPHLIEPLGHRDKRLPSERKKVYSSIALLAHLTSCRHAELDWSHRARELLGGFPANQTVSLETDMGVPSNWRSEQLWLGPSQ